MKIDKPQGWGDTVDDLIRAKFNYEDTNAGLKKKFGEVGAISGEVYRAHKDIIDGGTKVDEKLDEMGERKQVKKPKVKTSPVWSKQKQQAADTSKLAEIINMGLYQGMMPFCATQQLEQKLVQEVNPGGAVVASINYYFPDVKLEHPLVTLGVRIVILYVKFRSICGKLQKSKDPAPVTQGGATSGLKPGMVTTHRK